ncbi:MAG: hypothetical protein IIA85_00550 [Nanoarchaeota archaeon]|nr:hypothetical protein [Nanoarchaeota archaeon]
MEIEKILEMETESILAIEELGKLAVNDSDEFSVIWMHNYDYSSGLFRREKDEKSARTLADVAATNAVKYNEYEEDGETVSFGKEYYVYDSKGKRIYTGRIKQNITH